MASVQDGTGQEGMQIEVASFRMAPGTIVTARSHLIDRMVPACEVISLPEKTVPGGTIPFATVERLPFATTSPRLRDRLRGRVKGEPVPLEGTLGFDCRFGSPENWAHFLNIHAPLTFALTNRLGIAPHELTLILPQAIPGFVLRAAAHLGLRTQVTDAEVIGPGVVVTLATNIIRPDRRRWLMDSGVIGRLAAAGGGDFPANVLLARRKTRELSNQPEIEATLASRGFRTIYPEDLSVPEQFALFNGAETIVAVHGAGLAPLLYRQPQARLRRLVELLPCGHMTDVYRGMSQQVGCAWIGVRGRIKPEYIRPAYVLDTPFTRYSLDNFEVDPASLDLALDMIADAPLPGA